MIEKLKNLPRHHQQLGVGAIVLVLLAAAGVVFALTRGDGDTVPENVAFKVGDREVTISELNDRNELLKAFYGLEAPSDTRKKERDLYRRDSAKSFAISMVEESAADEANIDIPDDEVDRQIKKFIKGAFDVDRYAFLASLGNVGASEKALRAEIRRRLEIRALEKKFAPDTKVSDAELAAGFEKYKGELGQPEKRTISNIVVATRSEATKVRNRLTRGEAIATVAKQVSIDQATRDKGGKLGSVSLDQLEPAVGKAIFTTPVGKVYGPAQGQYGWNVGVVTKIDKPRPPSLKRDGDLLRQVLALKKSTDAWTAWLEKRLRDANIVYAKAYQPKDPYDVSTFTSPAAGGGGEQNGDK
ncbi:MAG: peptidylprolyl isomerase [Nocardioidaceae bacterium]|nr:peptidylprolyl isomerase [Nocardioidaceae bacterium]